PPGPAPDRAEPAAAVHPPGQAAAGPGGRGHAAVPAAVVGVRARGDGPELAPGRLALLPGRDHRRLQLHREHAAPQDLPAQRARGVRADHADLRRHRDRRRARRARRRRAGALDAPGRGGDRGREPPARVRRPRLAARARRPAGPMTAGRGPPPVRRLGAAAAAIALAALAATAGAQAGGGAALRAEAAQLLRELAALRGTPSGGGPPPIVIRTREQRRRYVAAEFARKYSPARLEAERRAMVAWGLLPPEFDLAGFLVDLLAEQAAAYYDPVAKQMILANWLTPGLQSDALAHELVHALQDRTVGLEGFLAVVPGRSDAGLARQALVEGEAVALVLERTLRRQGRALAAQADVEDLR